VSEQAESLVGKVLGGRYRIDTLLGSGAVGRVYAAEHVLMHKPLAVKVLHAEHAKSRDIVARFEREATAAANIDHANVVAAMDFGKLDDGTVYLALELVQGNNLRAEIAKGPLGVRRALHVARQVALGLAAAHARNIVHRDLKPENIVLVEKDGDPDFVKILDFGIAKLTDESGKNPLTKVGMVLGTFDYMAPEQALGKAVDGRADLYALGVVLYEMLSGVCPYEGESAAAILKLQLTKRAPSFAERAPGLAIPPAVEPLVIKLLEKEPKDRPAFAAAVAAQLAELMSSLPADAAAVGPAGAAKSPPGAPRHNRPTFLPSDPLPQFTFPPTVEESRKLAQEVQAALASAPPPPPRRTPPLASGIVARPDTAVAPAAAPSADASSVGKPALDPAGAAPSGLLPKLRAAVALGAEIVFAWIEDNRRLLPRFIRRPLRRVPTPALALGLFVLAVLALWVVARVVF
jgi:serine/threonine-protein kinase